MPDEFETELQRQVPTDKPLFFGLSLIYETGLVNWAWRDAKNTGIGLRYVRLDPDNLH